MPTVIWEFVPDVVALERRRTRVRLVALALSVLLVALGWLTFGVAGGMVAVGVMVVVNLTVHAWARGMVVAGPQRVFVDVADDLLTFEGPDIYRRAPGDEAFDEVDEVTVPLDRATRVTVYPATTRTVDGPGPPSQFHLVVDVTIADGTRWCVSFDRRIPFRIGGELALVDAIADHVGPRWVDPLDDRLADLLAASVVEGDDEHDHDRFGALDRRRLDDWRDVVSDA